MKIFRCFLLVFVLLLAGCRSAGIDSTTFFYCRNPEDKQYFTSDGVIVSEARDLSGHKEDLRYLIALYLAGPLEENMVSPFPRKTRLVQVETLDTGIQIELTDLDTTMTDSEFSLAATCLAKTCMQYSGKEIITVRSGIRAITVTAGNVIVFDQPVQDSMEGE